MMQPNVAPSLCYVSYVGVEEIPLPVVGPQASLPETTTVHRESAVDTQG